MLGLMLGMFPMITFAQSEAKESKPASSPQIVTIPKGTPIPMRFAQAVWGFPISPFISDPPRPPFRVGDKVRLVAAADVSAGGQLVVRKGSLGQATVVGIWTPNRKHPSTGIDLQWDWIKTIDDQQVAIKPFLKRKRKVWPLDVYSDQGGFYVNQEEDSVGKILFKAFTYQYAVQDLKKKLWVPTGTRITGYVEADVPLYAARLAEAQSRFPMPNSTALLTIYRVKGHKEKRLDVVCDGKAAGQLGERQYLVLDLGPGMHSCQTEKFDPFEFSVSAGREYYLYLRSHALTDKWTFESVETPVGEDGIAEAELVGMPKAL